MSAHPLGSGDLSEQRLSRMLLLSGADLTSNISISGPDSLEVLGALCRRDFTHVQCARFAVCNADEDESDVLILAGRLTGAQVADRLHHSVRLLRSGGVLVAHLEDIDTDLLLEAVLQAENCDVQSSVFDLSHEVLVAHRLFRMAVLRRAA